MRRIFLVGTTAALGFSPLAPNYGTLGDDPGVTTASLGGSVISALSRFASPGVTIGPAAPSPAVMGVPDAAAGVGEMVGEGTTVGAGVTGVSTVGLGPQPARNPHEIRTSDIIFIPQNRPNAPLRGHPTPRLPPQTPRPPHFA